MQPIPASAHETLEQHWAGKEADGSRKAAAGPVSFRAVAPVDASTDGRACAGGLPKAARKAARVCLAPLVQTRDGLAQQCPILPTEHRESRRAEGKTQLNNLELPDRSSTVLLRVEEKQD